MNTPDPKDIVRKFVSRMEIDSADVHDYVWDPDRSEEDADALVKQVMDLFAAATLTVTFPGDPGTDTAAQLIRHFADKIDLGPDIPLPPSVYSALARETADALDGRGAESEGK